VEYLSLIAELAVAFAGFTAIVSVLQSEVADEFTLNKVRLRQMLELSLFTVAASLVPQLIAASSISADMPFRISGALFVPAGAALLTVQRRRGAISQVRKLPGYSVRFTRFAIGCGLGVITLFALAAFGAQSVASYQAGVTLGLVIAAAQFFRTSISVLRLPVHAGTPD
jgi:hypothetical protein